MRHSWSGFSVPSPALKWNSWDIYYLQMAHFVATKSKDPSTQTGAAIVRPNRTLSSVGFNGFPQCMPDNSEWYANRDEKYSRIVHCEVNAQVLSEGPVRGSTLYTWPFACCDRCASQMLQAGIIRFVYPTTPPHLLERWQPTLDKTRRYFQECKVEAVEIPHEDIPPILLESYPGQYDDLLKNA